MQPCHAPRRDNDDSVQFAFDEIDELADGRDLVLKLEIDAQLLLQIHDHFDGIQRIDTEAFERGVAGDLVRRDIELRGQIRLNLLKQLEFLRCYGCAVSNCIRL